jgi:hypothetical protein
VPAGCSADRRARDAAAAIRPRADAARKRTRLPRVRDDAVPRDDRCRRRRQGPQGGAAADHAVAGMPAVAPAPWPARAPDSRPGHPSRTSAGWRASTRRAAATDGAVWARGRAGPDGRQAARQRVSRPATRRGRPRDRADRQGA